MPPEPAVLAAYRRLLRACSAAFRGDAPALAAARAEIRSHYAVPLASPADLRSRLADSDEAATFLGSHVVQGVLNERGNYRVELGPEHADATGRTNLTEPGAAATMADDKVLQFMLDANRPYAVQGVADMLATQGVRKPAAQKALEAHAAAGRLTAKSFGKATLYWRPQPEAGAGGAAASDVAAATARLAALNEELAAVNATNAKLSRDLAAAQAAPSAATVAARTKAAEEALPGLRARLADVDAAKGGGGGGGAAPRLDRATIQADLSKAVAAWTRNRRIFNAAWDAVSENMDCNPKSMFEEMGVVTDKEAGVDLGVVRALLAGVGGAGGGSVGKRGRA